MSGLGGGHVAGTEMDMEVKGSTQKSPLPELETSRSTENPRRGAVSQPRQARL